MLSFGVRIVVNNCKYLLIYVLKYPIYMIIEEDNRQVCLYYVLEIEY